MTAAEAEQFDVSLPGEPAPIVAWPGEPAAYITVGIVDEHQMFALGLRTCLSTSPLIKISPVVDDDVDVVIVSTGIAEERCFAPPLVVCGAPPTRLAPGNDVRAVLSRTTLTADQLVASTTAAAAGRRVAPEPAPLIRPADRRREVLSLLAAGVATPEIAERLGCSSCMIKHVIRDIQASLGAKNRTQAVAEAIRQGLI